VADVLRLPRGGTVFKADNAETACEGEAPNKYVYTTAKAGRYLVM
jgi:hypothetical protein